MTLFTTTKRRRRDEDIASIQRELRQVNRILAETRGELNKLSKSLDRGVRGVAK